MTDILMNDILINDILVNDIAHDGGRPSAAPMLTAWRT
jgi:hypothetical protein